MERLVGVSRRGRHIYMFAWQVIGRKVRPCVQVVASSDGDGVQLPGCLSVFLHK